MLSAGFFQVVVFFLVLFLCVIPLGWYMANVYEGTLHFLAPFERAIYSVCRIDSKQDMNWKTYLSTMLFFNLLGVLFLYLLQRVQFYLPLNPQHFVAPSPELAFNTAASFVTNTNWQAYHAETTMSYGTQMLGFGVQNFLSAATGMSLLMALVRGIRLQESTKLGNFWVDIVRGILYILLPLSSILAIVLVSQGVIQNFKPYQNITPMEVNKQHSEQVIPMGPVASQIAIKQLGTNGGGFFNANSAHPFENPTPLTNFLEMLALILIPLALCHTFGIMIKDKRQGWALLIAMFILFIPFFSLSLVMEQQGNPALTELGIEATAQNGQYPGGNMEGKETRFGIVGSVLYATLSTATSNGSQNSILDSYTPLAGLGPLWLMQLGEVIFGGVGSGLYGMLMLVVMTVFVAGLMVGRTPEYLGKKIEPFEMKMASVAILVMPIMVLISTAVAAVIPSGTRAIGNPGAHGFTEILYAFTSMGNNNGSAFTGLQADNSFYNIWGGIVMLISRYWIAIPVLAIAGSLAQKKRIPTSSGTLLTHTPLFIILLVCITMLIGALSFFPVLALGPIVEHLMLWGQYGH